MPCGLLVGFRKTETHSRVRNGCHVSTSSGRGVTFTFTQGDGKIEDRAKISIKFLKLKYFLKFRSHNRSGQIFVYLNGLGYQMPYGPLIGFQEIVTHSMLRDGCHVSTLFGSGRDNFIGIRAKFSKIFKSFSESSGYRLLFCPCLVRLKIKYLSFKKTSKCSTTKRMRPTVKGDYGRGGSHLDTVYSCTRGRTSGLTRN